MKEEIALAYGGIFEPALIAEISGLASFVDFKEGDKLIEIGQYIRQMPLLVSGAIKILREDHAEGELLLYFLEKGDTCAMTLACCMGDTKSEIRAIAETAGTVAMIPVAKMEEWLGKYKSWRNFVFSSYNKRLSEMLTAIDNLAFMKMDERLLSFKREGKSEQHCHHRQYPPGNSLRAQHLACCGFQAAQGHGKRTDCEIAPQYHRTFKIVRLV